MAAVPQVTQMSIIMQKSDAEMEMTFLMNELAALAMQSQTIVEEQNREGQRYMSQHKDAEGQVDISAIEYVNSDAFNNKYKMMLSAIDTKERELDTRKQQTETKQKMLAAQEDGWQKTADKNIQNTYKYGG